MRMEEKGTWFSSYLMINAFSLITWTGFEAILHIPDPSVLARILNTDCSTKPIVFGSPYFDFVGASHI